MKPMSLLLCGIAVSSLAVGAQAQHAPHDANRQSESATAQSPAPRNDPHGRQAAPSVPRGDLRGDIASNARQRAENSRQP
jgi:hypothetical protein